MSTTLKPVSTAIPHGFKALPLPTAQLSLPAVLKCGQSFRWTAVPLPPDESDSVVGEGAGAGVESAPMQEWRFCLKDRVVCLRQSEEFLFFRSVFPTRLSKGVKEDLEPEKETETLAFIRDYFQLDTDLLELYDTWSASDPVFARLRRRFKGIRMLRQDPWECLISFICSSNNNISRISKMVQNLCTHFSSPLLSLAESISMSSPPCPNTYPTPSSTPTPTPIRSSLETTPRPMPPSNITTYHPFPPPSALSSPSTSSKLRALGFGYRAEFIQKTACMLLEAHNNSDQAVFDFLEGLRKMETQDARAELLKLLGVGRKVADCVLLMSLDKREVVPVDTHVYQIAVKHYGMRGSSNGKMSMIPKIYDEVNARLAKIWGNYAGWAHSVLFTADLKSFSTYGLPTPSPTPSPSPSRSASTSPARSNSSSRTPTSAHIEGTPEVETPTPPRKKRKQSSSPLATNDVEPTKMTSVRRVEATTDKLSLSNGSLVDRVKRRRRITVSKNDIMKEF
ncbi:OGG1 [Sanghuangporus sanghuang]